MDESMKSDEKSVEEKVDNSETQDISTSNSIKELLKNLPEVLIFIERLQECIIRQRSLIHRLYGKLKEADRQNKQYKDEYTQTGEEDFNGLQSNVESGNFVEDIKQAAENAVQQTGFVYESTSGMYYDYNTGYYYNAELGLYYDGNSGIYYYFDESSKSFQFHSQLGEPTATCKDHKDVPVPKEHIYKRKEHAVKNSDKIPKKIKIEQKEEGECTESSSESESENEMFEKRSENQESSTYVTYTKYVETEDCITEPNIAQNVNLDSEIANAWPPCLRVIVKETMLDNLPVGSLFIVTCTGGTLGREGDHAIIIPDINISKHHAKVSFSESEKCYNIVDLGSRNGTYVDGKRISVALQESDPVSLQHRTVVRVGTTRLECHLHLGRETCDECEPGCALYKQADNIELTNKDHETKESRHRSELRKLRKRFGLDKLTAKDSGPLLAPGYQDRAEERRKIVGSQDHNAKTEAASVDQCIQSNNKGFKMLSKMGWSKGQSLGKDTTKGITEPVLVEQRPEKAGLGSDLVHMPAPDPKAKKKTEVWKKAQKRFQELDG